jgi:hypothetical protein
MESEKYPPDRLLAAIAPRNAATGFVTETVAD